MPYKSIQSKLIDNVAYANALNTEDLDISYIDGVNFYCKWTKVTPSNKTFDTGTLAVQTLTLDTKANMVDGEWLSWYEEEADGTETRWALACDKTGSTAEPTDPDWLAIPSANKDQVDISGDTTAAQVAASYELAADGLTGMGVVTDDTAGDGTMTFTQIVPGVITDATAAEEDGGAGQAASWANTTPGVATEVDPVNNQVSVPAHGYKTGQKITELTTTGTLPDPLAVSTVYYAIVPSADLLKFATSQALAAAGTAIDLTDYGATTSVHTIVVATTLAGTVDIQASNDDENYIDVIDSAGASIEQTISDASGEFMFNLADLYSKHARAAFTITSGQAELYVYAHAKGNS